MVKTLCTKQQVVCLNFLFTVSIIHPLCIISPTSVDCEWHMRSLYQGLIIFILNAANHLQQGKHNV